MGRVGAGLRGSFLASRGIPNGIVPASVRQTAAATIVFAKTNSIWQMKSFFCTNLISSGSHSVTLEAT